MYVCLYVCIFECLFVCMYVCRYVYLYVCMSAENIIFYNLNTKFFEKDFTKNCAPNLFSVPELLSDVSNVPVKPQARVTRWRQLPDIQFRAFFHLNFADFIYIKIRGDSREKNLFSLKKIDFRWIL